MPTDMETKGEPSPKSGPSRSLRDPSVPILSPPFNPRQVMDPNLVQVMMEGMEEERLVELEKKKIAEESKTQFKRPVQLPKGSNCILKIPPRPDLLSLEIQQFYKELTKGCCGTSNDTREACMETLKTDPVVQDIVPYLSAFIEAGVQYQILKERNIAILIYLMQMVDSLLENKTINLVHVLHELLPTVITCLVCSKVCSDPAKHDHWAFRDYSGMVLGKILRREVGLTDRMESRTVALFSSQLPKKDLALPSVYGIVVGIAACRKPVIKDFLWQGATVVGKRLQGILGKHSQAASEDILACHKIKKKIVEMAPKIFLAMNAPVGYIEGYQRFIENFGSDVCLDLKF